MPSVPADLPAEPVAVGDRVVVTLPDKALPRGRGGNVVQVPVSGVVSAVTHRGVTVRLDRSVNGVGSCYATHAEARRA
jgi:hypothetical protein